MKSLRKLPTPEARSPVQSAVELFKVAVAHRGPLNLSHAVEGFVTDFAPDAEQLATLRGLFKPLPITTLFSVEERMQASAEQLLLKQLLHYIEVYGLDAPGLFQLEVSKGQIATIAYVRAVTVEELADLVHGLAYANRPIKDVPALVGLMREYSLPYELHRVQNNELRVALFDPLRDRFQNGDDAVRYICYQATHSPMLIKSREVIEAVQRNPVGERFLREHLRPLARVFNRHERIIMACKHPATASAVNRISKLSKKPAAKGGHVPWAEPIAKNYIALALAGKVPLGEMPSSISIRDKFRYLNLIEYRLLGLTYDTFVIRNGKVWSEHNRTVGDIHRLREIQSALLDSLTGDLRHLHRQRVLLDGYVDYGLPISRKQAMGNLPYGTRVTGTEPQLSAGIYWKNQGTGYESSVDLDLSAIDDTGQRTGWGLGAFGSYQGADRVGSRGWAGYDRGSPIIFSGDVTSAPKGASEFMVVRASNTNRYGLMVNIFRGPEPCEAEVVVGHPTGSGMGAVWQGRTLIRERISLQSRANIIGWLKNDKDQPPTFVVYGGRLGRSIVSGGRPPITSKALGKLWTLGDVLRACGIAHDTTPQPGVAYDHDLRYEGFTLDRLERLLGI